MSHLEQQTTVVRVAIFPPAPPERFFDYLLPPECGPVTPGCRVQVIFGRRRKVGVIIESGVAAEVDQSRLRTVEKVLDDQPALPADLLDLLRWTARYYQYPIGRVLQQTVPRLIRRGDALCEGQARVWAACCVVQVAHERLARAPFQQRVFALLADGGPLSEEELNGALPGWRRPMKELAAKGLVAARTRLPSPPAEAAVHRLNREQAMALDRITASAAFECHLIEGVTGSGKTEVYLRAAEAVLNRGGQVLILVPEIGLTSQTVFRFRRRHGLVVSVFHSGIGDRERLHSWSRARTGAAGVVIGTRSAMFLPFKSLGMIVVDEEHDTSYKQYDTLRYHARDLAIKRAQLLGIPVVLGSATPSLESLCNVQSNQYRHHRLSRRAGGAAIPAFEVLDLRGRRFAGGLSDRLLAEIGECVARDEQVLLFLNRRGYATQVLCHDCGEVAVCSNCDVPLVYHLGADLMRCHHCGHSAPRPEHCLQCDGCNFKDTGVGTERIEQELKSVFPCVEVMRIDADTVRRRGELDRRLAKIRESGARILVGTQMLSKGHHFPQVTLVGILNVDQRLFAPDFRALERLGQLVVQVSGRAGRGSLPGKVYLQTYHPDNPHLLRLVRDGYAEFARCLLVSREQARLPPYHFLSLVRAGAEDAETATDFLSVVRAKLKPGADRHGVSLLGPSPMILEKRGGRYRAQLLLSAASRAALNRCLGETLPAVRKLKGYGRVAWHVDVDPMEIE